MNPEHAMMVACALLAVGVVMTLVAGGPPWTNRRSDWLTLLVSTLGALYAVLGVVVGIGVLSETARDLLRYGGEMLAGVGIGVLLVLTTGSTLVLGMQRLLDPHGRIDDRRRADREPERR